MSNVARVEIRNRNGEVVPVQGLSIEDPIVVRLRVNTNKLEGGKGGGWIGDKLACKWLDEGTMEWKTSGCETDVSTLSDTGRWREEEGSEM